MSSPRLPLELSERAHTDLRDILAFTLTRWGEAQMTDYRRKLEGALDTIIANPEAGRQKHGLRVYPAGRHRVYYHLKANQIFVVRILHERMDAVRHLTI